MKNIFDTFLYIGHPLFSFEVMLMNLLAEFYEEKESDKVFEFKFNGSRGRVFHFIGNSQSLTVYDFI